MPKVNEFVNRGKRICEYLSKVVSVIIYKGLSNIVSVEVNKFVRP